VSGRIPQHRNRSKIPSSSFDAPTSQNGFATLSQRFLHQQFRLIARRGDAGHLERKECHRPSADTPVRYRERRSWISPKPPHWWCVLDLADFFEGDASAGDFVKDGFGYLAHCWARSRVSPMTAALLAAYAAYGSPAVVRPRALEMFTIELPGFMTRAHAWAAQ
jgi:hypothetical protein